MAQRHPQAHGTSSSLASSEAADLRSNYFIPDGKTHHATHIISIDSEWLEFDAQPPEPRRQQWAAFKRKWPIWQRTWIASAPLSGICSLVIALTSMCASFAILVGSDGASVASWTFAPSVYLGISTSISHQALAYASLQGAIVAWWTIASKGSTVAKLQRDWSAGISIIGALRAGPQLRLLGIACLVCALTVVVDGPLYQSASSVVEAEIVGDVVPLLVSIAPEVPSGYTGFWTQFNASETKDGHRHLGTGPSAGMNRVDVAFQDQSTMGGFVKGCPGTCRAQIEAPALAVSSCREEIIHLDMQPNNETSSEVLQDSQTLLVRTLFMLSLELVIGERESLSLITGFSNPDDSCKGYLNLTTCSLESAVGLYDVSITHDAVVLTDPVPTILRIANNTEILPFQYAGMQHPSTLVGVSDFFKMTHATAVQLYNGYKGHETIWNVYGDYMPYEKIIPDGYHIVCPSFNDPRQSTLKWLNQLMFRIGLDAAQYLNTSALLQTMDPGLKAESVVNGTVVGNHNVFQTNYYCFTAAAIVELVCVAVISPLYWGFWTFRRAVSFSPLELAKAFDAPLLAHCEANSSGREVAKVIGEHPIRYDIGLSMFTSS